MNARFFALAALPLAVLACAGDDTNPPLGDAGRDAATTPGDGSMLDAAQGDGFAPGNDGGDVEVPGNDGGDVEVGGDAAPQEGDGGLEASSDASDASDAAVSVDADVDAGPPVTVHALDFFSVGEPGVEVLYSNSSGAILGTVPTDATGTASLAAVGVSQVTVFFGIPESPAILTIAAVEPGDDLTVIDATSAAFNFFEGVTLTDLPAAAPDGGANFVVSAGACGAQAPAPPFTFDLYTSPPPCLAAGAFPLLVVDQLPGGAPLAYAYQKGYAIDAGAAAASARVSIGGATWAPPVDQTLLVTNVPSAGFSAPAFVLTEIAGGVPSTSSPTAMTADAGAYSLTFSTHPGYADSVQGEANLPPSEPAGTMSGGAVVAAIAENSVGFPLSPLDLGRVPPFVTGAALTSPSPALSWTSASSLASTDGVIAIVTWSGGTWTFVTPPSAMGAEAPALPMGLAAWAPPPGASFDLPVVIALQASYWSGYSDLRHNQWTFVPQSFIGPTGCSGTNGACLPVIPQGTLAVSAFVSAP